jgi:hypothetical protein
MPQSGRHSKTSLLQVVLLPAYNMMSAVGDVPLKWYKDEDHIGYDIKGTKINKSKRADKLDALLARNDRSAAAASCWDQLLPSFLCL